MRPSKMLLLLFLTSIVALANPTVLDYWESNPKIWREMLEERRIFVSAKNENGQTISKGAGFVRGTPQDVWSFATNPDKIVKSSRFLKSFTWDKTTGLVDMQIELLMISHRLRGKATERPDPENPRITLEVHEGSIVPFNSELEIRSAAAQKRRAGAPEFSSNLTMVKLTGTSSKDRSLSWPLRVALEAVLQRSAGHLRDAVEAEVSQSKSQESQSPAP